MGRANVIGKGPDTFEEALNTSEQQDSRVLIKGIPHVDPRRIYTLKVSHKTDSA